MTRDYQIILLDGMTTNEVVTENEDSTYTIFINQNLCEAKQLLAVQHALEHIHGNDFEKDDVQKIEFQRHAV